MFAAHYVRADALTVPGRQVGVHGRSGVAGDAAVVEAFTAGAERFVRPLVRPGDEAVERHGQLADHGAHADETSAGPRSHRRALALMMSA